MPRIQPYQPQTGAPRPVSTTVDFGRGAATSALGAALESVADDQARLKAFERQKAEERAAVWANEQVMQMRTRWVEELPRRQETASETADGFARQVVTDFDAEADEAIRRAPTQAARDWLRNRLSQVRLSLLQDSLVWEARRGAEYKVSGLSRAIDQASIAAEFNPDDFPTLAAEQLAAIEASGLNAEVQRQLIQDGQQKIASAAVQGMIRRNPVEALQELNNEKTEVLAVRALTFDQRQALRSRAQAEINRREAETKANLAELRQALNDQLADIRAAATAGMIIDSIPSREALQAAFGEREGAQRHATALAYAQMAPAIQGLYQAPANEIAEVVSRYQPTQVEGAAEQLQLAGIVEQKARSILQEREKDAGGYLVAHSPAVQRAWNAFQQASAEGQEEAASAYLQAVRAEKERLGIQSWDVLPHAYADLVVDRLTRPQGAETLATAMASEAQRWGAAWPAVYRQISKKLPDAALIIGSGIPKRAADTLALMSQRTPAELKQLIPPGRAMTDVERLVDDELADLTSTFGPEGATVLTAMRNSAIRTAIGYMASGSSFRDAIKQATADLANDRYTFQTFRGQTYRVPVHLDADLIDDGALQALREYTQPSGTVQVPPGTPEEVILSQATDHIRRTGYWRTAPDESGLRLYVGNAVVPGADGRPVQLSWQQLEELGRQWATRSAVRQEGLLEELEESRL